MKKTIETKEELLAYIKKMLADQKKVKEYLENKRTLSSLKKEGIILEKLG